jgi:aspartate/glutamate racemase
MKEIIATTEGARPVGPYSQAIRANGLIFVSGQIPLDPRTHEFSKRGIEILSPHPRAQQFIDQKYMTELVFGKVVPETRISLLDIVKQMRHSKNIDGLILGGTELSLILSDGMLREVSFLDTTSIHVNAAVTQTVAEFPIIR